MQRTVAKTKFLNLGGILNSVFLKRDISIILLMFGSEIIQIAIAVSRFSRQFITPHILTDTSLV